IRGFHVTGVQTCALPISGGQWRNIVELDERLGADQIGGWPEQRVAALACTQHYPIDISNRMLDQAGINELHSRKVSAKAPVIRKVGRASCREGGQIRGEG